MLKLVLSHLPAAQGFPSQTVVLFVANFLTATLDRYNLIVRTNKRIQAVAERRRTEQRNQASKNLDHMSASEIVRLMNREDQKVPAAIANELPSIAAAVDGIVGRIRRGGRLIYVGAGTSGRLGVLDASECPPTFGVTPKLVRAIIAGGKRALTQSVEGAEDNKENAKRDLNKIRLSTDDIVVGLAASGTTPYVLAAVALAKKCGALTIGVSANRDSPLARAVHIPITPDFGPEVLTGSTRLKAGTSQKMVLNMLSTATMVRLGHAYENLMIDLTRTNQKLRDRANRILVEASGKDVSAAEHALRQSEHDLRVALVMLKRNVDATQARRVLKRTGGNLRRALGE